MRPFPSRPAIALLPILALVAACDRAKRPERQPEPAPAAAAGPTTGEGVVDRRHKGLALPALPFEAPGGGPATFGPFRGKPLLVNLWATWCGPCVRELPTLDALAAREKGKLAVVAVSEDTGGAKQVGPFWQAKGYRTLAPYTDARMRLMTALEADVLPTTILYGRDGREVLRVTGGMDWSGAEAAKLLAEVRPQG